jgi:hypothetical protein
MGTNMRRGLIALGAILVILGVALAIGLVNRKGPGAIRIPGPAGSPGSAAWGVDGYSAPPDAIRRLEQAMGRPFGAFSDYVGLDGSSRYPNRVARDAMARQALIYLNINSSHRAGGHKLPYCWADIAAGRYDSMLDSWSKAILTSGYRRMVITFEHEPNVQNVHQPKCAGDSPTAYRAAFHHVYRRMRADGVRFPFAFVPTVSTYRTGVVNGYAPRKRDYQVIGADVYNRVAAGQHHYHSAVESMMPMYRWIRANAPGKPVLIGEIGDTQRDPQAARWIARAIGLVRSQGNLLAINWNVTTTAKGPYSPLVNPQALATWVEGARLAYFRQLPSSPPGPAPSIRSSNVGT